MTDSDHGLHGADTHHRAHASADREGHPRDDQGPASLSDGVTAPSVERVSPLLAAAVRGGGEADSVGEARAVAAFLAARETGARTARTRRRDDWRPNARRRVQLSIRTTLAVLMAGLTLGGVAFAAVGPAARDDEGAGREHARDGGQERRPRTADSAPARPGPSTADRPDLDQKPTASGQPGSTDGPRNGGGKPDGKGHGKSDGNDKGRSEGGKPRPSSRPAGPDASRAANESGRPGGEGRRPAVAERDEAGAGRKPGGETRGPETK
ncbi:hypothetical protein QBB34_16405 [Streptomyces stelliscabiei]|uniref:hypothetical protein n=1 Tax=Streptomyces stelliscabiei TaxID=146820 RepID=UPI002FF23CC1